MSDDRDEHSEAVLEFLGLKGLDEDEYLDPPEMEGSLDEALRAMGELGLWPDFVDSVSANQALVCWRIVETMRKKRLPEDLRM